MLYAHTTRPPFDHADVQRDSCMAIDRDRIVKEAMQDYTRPADATGLDNAHVRFHYARIAQLLRW